MESSGVEKIVLNEEQTKRFLSFFIPEAIELVRNRRLIAETEKEGKTVSDS